jgi:hypothetical protein
MNNPFPTGGSDAGLTAMQHETLAVVLNMIVPPGTDGRMPGASEMAVLRHIAERSHLAGIREDLDKLERDAIDRFGAAFAALDEVRRLSLLDEMRASDPMALHELALATVTCYYQQDRVLEGLGIEARPPYPKGYQVETGDLSLLQPVIARGKIYRDAP